MSASGLDIGGEVAAVRRHRVARDRTILVSLAIIVVIMFAIALCVGDYPLAVGDIVRSLLSPFTGDDDPATDFIVLTVRLPRATTAILAGAAFGLSGVIFQTLLRNPLASPDIVGVSLGASAAAVAAIVLAGWAGPAVSLAAFAGAMLTALANYLLAWRQGVSPYRMVLVGIGLAAILGAVISYLFTSARIEIVQKALAWLVGSLNGSTFDNLWPLAAALVFLVPAAVILLRPLGNLELGDDAARSLGTRAETTRLALLVVAVALTGFATAAVGPVAFVAFVAGPIAKQLLHNTRSSFFGAPLVGAIVMLTADLGAQHLLERTQLPVGVVTGALGALFLIYLLISANREGRAG